MCFCASIFVFCLKFWLMSLPVRRKQGGTHVRLFTQLWQVSHLCSQPACLWVPITLPPAGWLEYIRLKPMPGDSSSCKLQPRCLAQWQWQWRLPLVISVWGAGRRRGGTQCCPPGSTCRKSPGCTPRPWSRTSGTAAWQRCWPTRAASRPSPCMSESQRAQEWGWVSHFLSRPLCLADASPAKVLPFLLHPWMYYQNWISVVQQFFTPLATWGTAVKNHIGLKEHFFLWTALQKSMVVKQLVNMTPLTSNTIHNKSPLCKKKYYLYLIHIRI